MRPLGSLDCSVVGLVYRPGDRAPGIGEVGSVPRPALEVGRGEERLTQVDCEEGAE